MDLIFICPSAKELVRPDGQGDFQSLILTRAFVSISMAILLYAAWPTEAELPTGSVASMTRLRKLASISAIRRSSRSIQMCVSA